MSIDLSQVLVVEDDTVIAEVCRVCLEKGGYAPKIVGTIADAIAEVRRKPYPLILLDLNLPDGHGSVILGELQARMRLHETAVIISTADATMKSAVDCMRMGAYDYLVKPFQKDRLLITLGNAKNTLSLQSMVSHMRDALNRDRFGDFIGGSMPMQVVYKIIEAAASSRATVFITGESGTGKEIAARTIHDHSRWAGGPFIALNCAAIPRELMESELFGHVKGAFTGATQDRMGAIERAMGGTLFMDEVCEMPLDLQAKLLRFLQGQPYQPVGSDTYKTASCRVICATNRDPAKEVAEGRFREDLYYRLYVVPLPLPPLRARRADILPIAMEIMRKIAAEENKTFTSISPEVQQIFQQHDWPGNVRQLINVMQQIIVLNSGSEITRAMLPPGIDVSISLSSGAPTPPTILESHDITITPTMVDNNAAIQPLWQVERRAIEDALEVFDGNVHLAADALQISPSTIYRKRQEWAEIESQKIA